jgi:predicted NUDIX family NTP pyrophosphohydrolase
VTTDPRIEDLLRQLAPQAFGALVRRNGHFDCRRGRGPGSAPGDVGSGDANIDISVVREFASEFGLPVGGPARTR